MALPIVAGIVPLLISIFQVFIAYRITRIIITITLRLLILAAIVALFLTVLVAIQDVLDSLLQVCPPAISQAYSMFMPSNFPSCVAAIITVQAIIFAWHWKKYAVETISSGVQ